MKAQIGPVEVTGTPAEIVALLEKLNMLPAARKPAPRKKRSSQKPLVDTGWTPTPVSASEFQKKVNLLTPLQRQAFNAVERHNGGIHHTVVAEELGVNQGTLNSRLAELRRKGLLTRIGNGAYRSRRPAGAECA